MADHEVLIQQLNRHHATKQFDLLRKIAKEGENRLELGAFCRVWSRNLASHTCKPFQRQEHSTIPNNNNKEA
jgi:hypothetical protein